MADQKLIFEKRCVFYQVSGPKTSCKVLREGSSCENCRFFKHKNDSRNNVLMEEHQLWIQNLPKLRAKEYAEAAKRA